MSSAEPYLSNTLDILGITKTFLRVCQDDRARDDVFEVELNGQVGEPERRVGPHRVGHGLKVGRGAQVRIYRQKDWQDGLQEEEPLATLLFVSCAEKAER